MSCTKDLREDKPKELLYYVSLIRAWLEVQLSIGIHGCKCVYCIDFLNFDTSLIRVLIIITKRSLRQCFHLITYGSRVAAVVVISTNW